MGNKVKVIGIGPGSAEYLLPKALQEGELCKVLIGSARALELFNTKGKETKIIDKNLMDVLEFIEEKRKTEVVGVLVSGDPGFYSMLAFLKKHIPSEDLEVIPGISSLQIAFSRLKLIWQEGYLLSIHGRPLDNLIPYMEKRKVLGVLVDKNCSLEEIKLLLKKWGRWKIHICGNLTYPEEFIITFNTDEEVPTVSLDNCVVVIEPDEE
ncbi:MAG: precorrin-6y C5,15-methyltransferase (decarboxylating) subunit CbiE [Clostridia bacterium]|nr:precorrin-6y C5,15-methyltransferase (decarboxylating) subunit CbiE [Clostridia bacterium]